MFFKLREPLRLSRYTLEENPHHISSQVFTSELLQSLGAQRLDSSVPEYHSWPKRFAHLVTNTTTHLSSGISFLEGKIIDQSGQTYIQPILDVILQRITRPPYRKKRSSISQDSFLVIPSIHAYYHWVVEWLPIVIRIKQLDPKVNVIMGDPQPKYVYESLDLLGVNWSSSKKKWANFPKLWLVDKAPLGLMHPDDLERVRDFSRSISTQPTPQNNLRIYIPRRGWSRAMSREDLLEKWLQERGFLVFESEDMKDYKFQIAMFSSANLIIGSTGSGLANAIFMPPGSRVIELYSSSFDVPETVRLLASASLDHRRLTLEASGRDAYGDGQSAIRQLEEFWVTGSREGTEAGGIS